MNLTREQTIENHRKLWNWIADETERLERKVLKEEYFYRMGIEDKPLDECYCCEYARDGSTPASCADRNICPIQWSPSYFFNYCAYRSSPYMKWLNSKTYEEAAKYAREIANLPEMEDWE